MTVSGMAASIRAATESETFDLAGNSVSTIKNTITDAFSSPLELQEMIRITFITGAGKLGRSKYDGDAAKTVTSTLRELGYDEDKGASCVVECAGCFKSQHDTGKNLKTIVVFPKIKTIAQGMGDMNIESGDGSPPVLAENTDIHYIAMSSSNVFQRMLEVKCASWSQKKSCVGVIEEIQGLVNGLDEKLMGGTPLTDSEQDFYDSCELSVLEQKLSHVRGEMHKQVDESRITSREKSRLLNQVTEKVQQLDKDIADATKNKKPKKLEKLKMQKTKAGERKESLEEITPTAPLALRFQKDIEKLRKEMQPLLKLESDAKGRLLSLKETTTLARKDEIEEEIADLEDNSRGWFEEDEDFQVRVDASRAQAKARATRKVVKKAGGGGSRATGGSKKAINTWVVPGAAKRPATRKTAKKKPAGNAFAAMMDSDSDSD